MIPPADDGTQHSLYSLDGFIWCATHRTGWQSDARPKPIDSCFADVNERDVARSLRSPSTETGEDA